MEVTLEALRKFFYVRDNFAPEMNRDVPATSTYEDITEKRMSHEEIQTYLLLKILARLEDIERRGR